MKHRDKLEQSRDVFRVTLADGRWALLADIILDDLTFDRCDSEYWPNGWPKRRTLHNLRCGNSGPTCNLVQFFDQPDPDLAMAWITQFSAYNWELRPARAEIFLCGSPVRVELRFQEESLIAIHYEGFHDLSRDKALSEKEIADRAVKWVITNAIHRQGRPEGNMLDSLSIEEIGEIYRDLCRKRLSPDKDDVCRVLYERYIDELPCQPSESTLDRRLRKDSYNWKSFTKKFRQR